MNEINNIGGEAVIFGLVAYANRNRFGEHIKLQFGIYHDHTGRHWLAKPVEFEEVSPDQYHPNPAITLTQAQAQRLMDEFWNVGLRPTEGQGTAGSLAATQAHLADMRKIAFDLLERGKDKSITLFEVEHGNGSESQG